MNKIINQYLIINFLKIILNTILIFLSLGIILNLFEEIEFFKNLDQSLTLPLILSLSFVPTLIVDLLPFIVFLASVFYFIHLKSNKDLLAVKIFGYSNLKITLIVASFAFLFGVFILIVVNPVTSALVKYYEIEKAKHAIDVDHLVSINKNGVWIKEINETGHAIINAEKLDGDILKKVSIYVFGVDNKILTRIESESAIISKNPWKMKNVIIYNFDQLNEKEESVKEKYKNYEFKTKKILDKINSVYKNLNTVSFIKITKDYKKLNDIGYSEKLLNEKFHKFISLPFFLFLMVVLASIFTIGSVNTKHNYYYIILSILTSVVIYYFKDLSIALGQTEKISLVLSVWMPIIAISLFCSIGVIQINEK